MPNYVVGHKIPDSDSICSAIALSYLKTTLGEETIPARLGELTPETLFILDYFRQQNLKYQTLTIPGTIFYSFLFSILKEIAN